MQLRAHRLSILNFQDLLRGGYGLATSPATEFVPARVLPASMLAVAALLFLGAVYNLNSKK